MTNKEMKNKVIAAGVKNLKKFGCPQVNKSNILTDDVYSSFFSSMLNDNIGLYKQMDEVINELQTEIKQPK